MRPNMRDLPSRALLCLIVLSAALAGCAREPRATQLPDDIYERSSHDLSQPPEAAAACVARNATQAGYFASPQPLFGTSAMSVSVRTSSAGDTLATLSLLPRNTGSRVTATTARERRQPARAEFLESLLKAC